MSELATAGSAAAEPEHPAVVAWRTLGSDRKAPSGVEALHAKNPDRRCVYRLLWTTGSHEPVIAKRYRAEDGRVERMLYREVLPRLPVDTPRCYGELEAGDGWVWIFLEDVGGQRFSPADPAHRTLAASWLGGLHTAAAGQAAVERLRHRGPPHYRAHLEAGRRLIRDNLGNPALRPAGVGLLRSVLALYEALEERWHALEEVCAPAPRTLVHGDFRPKNAYVRDGERGSRLLAIDWETAGWGVPAADLAPQRHRYLPQVDLETYCRVVRERWSGFDMRVARRLMWVGLIFRRLAAIEWAAVSLVFPRADVLEDPLARIRVYHEELGRALADPSWGSES